MLDQILNIIKEEATNTVSSNPEVPAEKKTQVVQTTTQAMAEGLKDNFSMSNLGNLSNLFSGDVKTSSTMNPVMESIKSTVSSALTQKAGLSTVIANGIAATIVPSVFKIFSNKVNDPNENEKGFNMDNLIKSFTGNNGNTTDGGLNAGNLLSSVGKLFH